MIENLFSKAAKTTIPKSIDECVKVDAISENLWSWSANVEKWGKILFWGLIIWGTILTLVTSITLDLPIYYLDDISIDFFAFITTIIQYTLYAFMEYIAYHIIALLIASLATITQSTKATARLAEYKARKAENDFGSSDKNDSKVTQTENTGGDVINKKVERNFDK